jgi:hypothetical protein
MLYANGTCVADLAPALFDLITLFLITQTRAQNIPLYLLFKIQFFFLSKLLPLSSLDYH